MAVALIPKFLLSLIQKEQDFSSIMITLSAYGVTLLVSGFFKNYAKEYSEAKYMKIRLSIIEENRQMFMKLPYSIIESYDFMDLCQKGQAALQGSEQGFHAVLTNISLLSGHVLTCIISFIYVSSYASYLLILIVIIVLLNRLIQSKQKKREKAIRDEMVSQNRQADYYYYDVMCDFTYGKEIRMYSLINWVERKLNYQEFSRFTHGKTAFYITHRLASTRFCDRIFVFSRGRLVKKGSHDELMALKGEYCSLYLLQSKYYSHKCQGRSYGEK